MSTHPFAFDPLEEHHLRIIAEAGFERIELWGNRPHFDCHDEQQIEQLAKWLTSFGLQIATVHLPFYNSFGSAGFAYRSLADADPVKRQELAADCRRLIDLCAMWDCHLAVLHPLGAKPYDGLEERRLRGELNWLLPYAIERGVDIALENIMLPQTRTAVLAEICRDYWPHVGICLDTGHANVEGGILAEIDGAGEYLLTLHGHDNRGQKDEHRLPGRGTIDWPAAFGALDRLAPNARYFTFELLPAALGGEETDDENRELFAAARRFWQHIRGEDS